MSVTGSPRLLLELPGGMRAVIDAHKVQMVTRMMAC
jgi:hypothetical protein